VILNQKDVYGALMYQEPPAFVISGGKLVVKNEARTEYYLG
jgi:hypothetical protein